MIRRHSFLLLLASLFVACGPSALPPASAELSDAGIPTSDGSADAGPELSAQEQARLAIAQSWLDSAVANDWAPGISVAIVTPEGEHFLSSGTLGWSSSVPVDRDTLFQLGSVSKTFTATAVAEELGEGSFQLSTPIDALVPPGVTVPTGPGGEKITVLQLATHHSGLPGDLASLWTGDPAVPYGSHTESELFAALSQAKLQTTPGAAFHYSNLGMGLLGHLAARADDSGSYEVLVARRIFQPLGMSRSSVTPLGDPNTAIDHAESGPVPPVDFSILQGAGAIVSSASDMTRYVRAQLDAEAGRDDRLPPGMGPAMRLTHQLHSTTGVPGYDLGLAWFRGWPDAQQLPDATGVFEHGGETFGARSEVLVSPRDGVGIVVLANSSILSGEDLAISLLRLWRSEDASYPVTPSLHLPTDTLDRYVGVYQLPDGFQLTVTREENRLFVRGTGQERFRIYADAEAHFVARGFDAGFTFHPDASGKVVSVTLVQDGVSQLATRVP